jgi:hypothetical protein
MVILASSHIDHLYLPVVVEERAPTLMLPQLVEMEVQVLSDVEAEEAEEAVLYQALAEREVMD